jgi:magnesium chelatase family protein
VALGRALAVAVIGMQGHLVEVEADIASGLPTFTLVGLPDASLSEARDRVRAATANSGHPLPGRRITVNLSPAGLPKAGTGFDLAVAAALLSASGVAPSPMLRRFVHVGELGLDGRVRPVRGVLPAALAAVRAGFPDVVVPAANAQEAGLVPGVRVWPVRHLWEVVELHGGEGGPGSRAGQEPVPAVGEGEIDGGAAGSPGSSGRPDLAEVIGQREGRRALEVAAAGGHHLLMVGPPGAGKTLLAARLPGLLPDLDDAQAIEVTALHSVAGTLDPSSGLIRRPPFESPHHTSTMASLVGGGNGLPRPGSASRAHRGVLFLDEAAEFSAHVLDSLRQPLEHGELVIHRANGSARFPARFQLVLATNPCPCGLSQGSGLDCTCVPAARRRYLARLSGPLLDRVDLQVEVLAVSRVDLISEQAPEDSATVAARVSQARARQRERLAGTAWISNGEVPGSHLRGPLRLASRVTQDLDLALERARLSIRGYDRVLRIAWTVADLAGRTAPDRDDVGRALMLRHRGRVLT